MGPYGSFLACANFFDAGIKCHWTQAFQAPVDEADAGDEAASIPGEVPLVPLGNERDVSPRSLPLVPVDLDSNVHDVLSVREVSSTPKR